MPFNINAIGDSHVGTFYPYCNISTLGPATMYSLTGQKLYDYVNYLVNRKEIDNNSWWLFCVGEIDIRCLFFKQIFTLNRQEDEVIYTLIDDYINNMLSLDHKQIIISTTVPPAKTQGFEDKLKNTINSKYPFIGSDEERNRWSFKLNTYLIDQCKNKNIKYVDIYNLFKDTEGFLDHQYIDMDYIHVSNRDPVVKELQKLNIN